MVYAKGKKRRERKRNMTGKRGEGNNEAKKGNDGSLQPTGRFPGRINGSGNRVWSPKRVELERERGTDVLGQGRWGHGETSSFELKTIGYKLIWGSLREAKSGNKV